jgi:Ricin-type beta-trefoil lectin domain-like
MKDRITCFVVVIVFLAAGSGCIGASDRHYAVSQHSGKCLGLPPAGGYFDGDPVQQWDCAQIHLGLQKEWLFVPLEAASSKYKVVSIQSGKCLEVSTSPTGGKNNGDIVQQSKCTGADNQKWDIGNTSAGTTFTSLYSGKCMQVRLGSTGGTNDGDAIEQWDCSAGAKNQVWKLLTTSPLPPNPPLDTGKGELCNLCNPAIGSSDCKPGARCILLPSGQSICGQNCSGGAGCPTGYTCAKIGSSGSTYYQCVPNNNSCPL